MKRVTRFVFILMVLWTAAPVFANGARDTAAAGGTQKIRVAHTQNYFPYDFINERGESDGFEVAVLKAVDALIPEYEFEFLGTTDDDLLIGVETGKYTVGVKGAWLTEERKQKFIIPEHYVGASVIGIAFRTENADKITDFESFARFSGKLVPIPPQSAQWPVVEEFNKNHPDAPVKLVPSDVFIISDAYTWVVEGRYDAFFDIKLSFDATVKDPNGAWHRYADRLSYAPYRAIPTYPLINKNYPDLAAKYDAVFQTLVDDGTLKKLSQQYFGEDIFRYN
ncbi:MAG: transporter substrate-binding domain-containing protein [Treponema sp.]|jgi:L-cystine transport system substrate-binding protein|nr:transporter substrate-binding domain-containing protein [Treponema sp.]